MSDRSEPSDVADVRTISVPADLHIAAGSSPWPGVGVDPPDELKIAEVEGTTVSEPLHLCFIDTNDLRLNVAVVVERPIVAGTKLFWTVGVLLLWPAGGVDGLQR